MVLARSHFGGQRQDQPAVDRDRLMKPAGLACNYLVCQTHYREVTYFQHSACTLRDEAVIWIMNSSGPNSGRAGAGGVSVKLVCLAQLRPGSGPLHGGSIPRTTQGDLRTSELHKITLALAVLLRNLLEQRTAVASSPQHTCLIVQTLLILKKHKLPACEPEPNLILQC